MQTGGVEPHLLRRYGSTEGARAYRHKYERSLTRRISNRRELAIVSRALERAAACGHVLDCPCGAGRLVPAILGRADHVTGIDISAAMVTEAGDALAPLVAAGRVELLVGSAARLPLADASVDTAVCHRLVHHLPDAADRARVLAELARVARRSVVLSFADDTTWKARSQRRRNIERRRYALTPEALYAEAEPHGLVPCARPLHLAGIFSLVAVSVFTVARPSDTPSSARAAGAGVRTAPDRS